MAALTFHRPLRFTVLIKDAFDDNGAWWFPGKLAPGGKISESQVAQLVSTGRKVDIYKTMTLLEAMGWIGSSTHPPVTLVTPPSRHAGLPPLRYDVACRRLGHRHAVTVRRGLNGCGRSLSGRWSIAGGMRPVRPLRRS